MICILVTSDNYAPNNSYQVQHQQEHFQHPLSIPCKTWAPCLPSENITCTPLQFTLKRFLNYQLNCSGSNERKNKLPALQTHQDPPSKQNPKNTNTSGWKKKHSPPKVKWRHPLTSTGSGFFKITGRLTKNMWKGRMLPFISSRMSTLGFCWFVLPFPFNRLQFLASHEEHPCGVECWQTNNFQSQCRAWSHTTFSPHVKKIHFFKYTLPEQKQLLHLSLFWVAGWH